MQCWKESITIYAQIYENKPCLHLNTNWTNFCSLLLMYITDLFIDLSTGGRHQRITAGLQTVQLTSFHWLCCFSSLGQMFFFRIFVPLIVCVLELDYLKDSVLVLRYSCNSEFRYHNTCTFPSLNTVLYNVFQCL